jgi:hypothetical protein
MSLEFYCRWSSTVAYKEIFKNYLKYWGSIVGGVLLSPYRRIVLPSARWRLLFVRKKIEIFVICFSDVDWECIPNSLRNWGVDLHFQPLNVIGNASLDFLNLINLWRLCLNLQAIWHIISLCQMWWRGSELLSILSKCRPLLAVRLISLQS